MISNELCTQAGFNFFGEVTIATQVSARMKTGFTLSSGGC